MSKKYKLQSSNKQNGSGYPLFPNNLGGMDIPVKNPTMVNMTTGYLGGVPIPVNGLSMNGPISGVAIANAMSPMMNMNMNMNLPNVASGTGTDIGFGNTIQIARPEMPLLPYNMPPQFSNYPSPMGSGPAINLTPRGPDGRIARARLPPFANLNLEALVQRIVYNEQKKKLGLSPLSDDANLPASILTVGSPMGPTTSIRFGTLGPASPRNNWNVDNNTITFVDGNQRKSFNGAGIMIIHSDNGTNNVILFGSKDGKYQEGGGMIETSDIRNGGTGNKILEQVAKREATEESANLFNFNMGFDSVPKIDIKQLDGKYYRVFVLIISGNLELSKNFADNKQKLETANVGNSWKESTSVAKFDMNSLFDCVKISSGEPNCGGRTIRGRTANVIKNVIYNKTQLEQKLLNPHSIKLVTNQNGNMRGTVSYVV